jgi:hypothetical protein
MATKDINQLIEESLEANWDTSVLEVIELEIEKASNVVHWLTGAQYRSMSPWPKQIEFALNLFEDYCPDCSDMRTVRDCWGKSLEVIKSQVTLLEFGKCPKCGKNRNVFEKEGKHNRHRELIGIAGQRCLDPKTPVLLADGTKTTLNHLRIGDALSDRCGNISFVTKTWKSEHPGSFFFRITLSTRVVDIECSDGHEFLTRRGIVCAAELKHGDLIEAYVDGHATWGIVGSELAVRSPITLLDIETSTGTFLHASGLVLHNSGKSFLSAEFAAYITHKLLCLDGVPCTRYGLINTVLRGTFVAGDTAQAAETVWGYFAAAVQESPWFKVYFAMLKDEERKKGMELYKFRPDGNLAFFHKKLELSRATADQATLRGRTRIIGSIDELGWFDNREAAKRRAGKEVYRALDNSLQTIRSSSELRWKEGFYDLPTAFMLNVSSPAAEDDPIMSIAAEKRNSKVTYIFHHPTWEINPEITLEGLADQMLTDPLGTMRDFGAEPGSGKNVLFPNPDTVYALIDDNKGSLMKYHKEPMEVKVKDITYNYVKAILDHITFDRTTPFILACDAGEVNNSFSLLLASLEEDVTIVNSAVIIQPEALTNGGIASVHFPSVLDFVNAMRKHISLEMVVFDRWQSTLVIQGLIDQGIDAKKHSLRYDDFKQFKQRVYEERIVIPKNEVPFEKIMLQKLTDYQPLSQLVRQLRTVRDTGRKIIKPPVGDDDVFRCLVLADKFMTENRERFANRGLQGMRQSKFKSFYANAQNMRNHQTANSLGLNNLQSQGVFIQKGRK